MTISYKILTDLNVIYYRHDGFATIEETQANLLVLAADPAFHPHMRHLFDLSGITGFEKDFASFFRMQARLTDIYRANEVDHFSVFFAPDGPGRKMADLSRRSWDAAPYMTVRIVDTLERAVTLVGVKAADFDRAMSRT